MLDPLEFQFRIQNFTDLIQPMTHNLHMEGIKSDGFANKIDDTLVPKE